MQEKKKQPCVNLNAFRNSFIFFKIHFKDEDDDTGIKNYYNYAMFSTRLVEYDYYILKQNITISYRTSFKMK